MHIHCQVRELLEQPKFGVLVTINADGTPQQTVMWYELIDDYILMNTEVSRTKVSNIKRDSRVSLCVEDSYNYVTPRGRAEVNSDPEQAQVDIARLAHRYREPEVAHQLISKFQAEERVTIWMSIDQVISKF